MITNPKVLDLLSALDEDVPGIGAAFRLGTWFEEINRTGLKVVAAVTENEEGDQEVHLLDLYGV